MGLGRGPSVAEHGGETVKGAEDVSIGLALLRGIKRIVFVYEKHYL